MAAMSKSFGFLAFLLLLVTYPLCCSANLTTGHSVLVDPKAHITSDIVNRNWSPIPSNLSHSAHLQFLEMAYNSLDGGIPTQIGETTALQGLQLGGNKINGTILQSIGNLHHLIVLGLKNNQIVGGVSTPNIFNLSLHQTLALNMNKLVGKQPRDVGNLTELKILDLSYNYFTGNELIGSLPNETCTKLPFLEGSHDLGINKLITALQGLQLGGNKLNEGIDNLRNLVLLALENNEISGRLPIFITRNLTMLRLLELITSKSNHFTGGLPKAMGQLEDLWFGEIFNISTLVSLSGTLPNNMCYASLLLQQLFAYNPVSDSLSNIQRLYFYGNKFAAFEPHLFGNFRSLQLLQLMEGQVNIRIELLSFITSFTRCRSSNIGRNSAYSILPPSLGNLSSSLQYFYAYNCTIKGIIPPDIGNLSSLVNMLSLFSNELTGNIPPTIKYLHMLQRSSNDDQLPSLLPLENHTRYLSLRKNKKTGLRAASSIWSHSSFNDLSGEIPDGGPFKNFTNVTPCRSISRRKSERKKVGFALFVVAGVVVLITIVSVVLIITRCGRKGHIAGRVDGLESVVPERISYYDIMRATECFSESNLLGIGSFGSVFFRGVVRDGRTIAVKVFSLQSEAALRSFDVECEVLRNIRHRNLVKVISCCSNEGFKALVLKYMPKGNLEKWLYSHNHCLDLVQRLNIMIDVASALEYLHHGCSTPIVHCDLKPSNVWLDEEMTAHVSDFGIAKLLGTDESNVLANTLATTGYIAPEYSMKGLVSTKCDVYSYGIMLMETFTRKRPSDDMFGGELSLRSWVESQVTPEVMDGNLVNPGERGLEKKLKCVSSVLSLGLQCAAISSGDRITMKQAVAELQKIKHQLLYRKQRTGF